MGPGTVSRAIMSRPFGTGRRGAGGEEGRERGGRGGGPSLPRRVLGMLEEIRRHVSRRGPGEAGEAGVEEGDVEEFAEMVQGLVEDEGVFAFAFGEVDHGVEDELDCAEDDRSGEKPDCSGVDEGMGAEGVDPEASRSGFVAEEAGEVGVAIFAEGEEPRLESKVGEGVADEEGEKDEQCGAGTSGHGLGGWQEGGHILVEKLLDRGFEFGCGKLLVHATDAAR